MADFCIHPETGKKQEIHSRFPLIRQDGQEPDCVFCNNAGTCEKHKGIFFIGEKYEPCENYVCRRQVEIEEPSRKREEEAALRAELKAITKPTPRPTATPRDCLYCQRLSFTFHCRSCCSGPHQGEGRIGDRYVEVIQRPEGEVRNCIYCKENFGCTQGRVLRNGQPCHHYVEFTAGAAEKSAG